MTQLKKIPLLKDHHTHPSVYSALGECVDLKEVSSQAEAIAKIGSAGDEDLCFAYGWDSGCFGFERDALDCLPPLFVLNISLHSFILNQAGADRLWETHPEIVNNAGNPDWIERNLPTILKMVVALKGCSPDHLIRFYSELEEQGVWYAEEMLLPGREVLAAFQSAGLLQRTRFWADPQVYRQLSDTERSQVAGIKLFGDGALGARTAALSQPYSTGEAGLLLYSNGALRELLEELVLWNRPLAYHTIGDRTIDQILDVLASLARRGHQFPAVRLEHCQFMSHRNAQRAKEMGLILSMQPNFSLDSTAYVDRLSAEQLRNNNPFRLLIDEAGFEPGKDLILGSDGMPHGVNFALQSALFPPEPGQALDLNEFVAGYCLDDDSEGSIEVQIDATQQRVFTRVTLPKEPASAASQLSPS